MYREQTQETLCFVWGCAVLLQSALVHVRVEFSNDGGDLIGGGW